MNPNKNHVQERSINIFLHFLLSLITIVPKNELQPQKEGFQYHSVDFGIRYSEPYSLEYQ